jgi:hypothetical protein
MVSKGSVACSIRLASKELFEVDFLDSFITKSLLCSFLMTSWCQLVRVAIVAIVFACLNFGQASSVTQLLHRESEKPPHSTLVFL